MALFDTVWYVNSVGHAALTQWAANTAYTVGQLRRQLAAPAVASERVFCCVVAGTSHLTTEPSWTLTRGAKTTDNTVTWQEMTGVAAFNGDTTNTPLSSALRSLAPSLGATVKNNSATHLFICTTAGTNGAGEPTFNTTTGATTTDNTTVWTCVGAINAFAGGAAPHARLRNALASGWFVNGSDVFIGHNSAETQAAAYSITAGQKTSLLKVYCHNAAGNYPPTGADVTTGATITTTGANAITLGSIGSYMEGLTFQAGSGAVSSNIDFGSQCGTQTYKNCSLQKLGTTGTPAALTGNSGVVDLIFDNCTFKFGAVTDSFRVRTFSRLVFKNSAAGLLASGSAVPTNFFAVPPTGASGYHGTILIEGCDLSQFGSGKTIVPNGSADTPVVGSVLIKDCKIDAAATLVATQLNPNTIVDVVRCSNTAGNILSARYTFGGSQTTELTIKRTGGASDGVTGFANKIVTTANCFWHVPFEMTPLAKMITTAGSPVTATVEGIWGGGAVPNNDDIWIEAVYLGDAASPLGSMVSGTKANSQATGSALAASAETWGGSTTAFKMSVTFTPQQTGLVYIYVKAGRASSTFYVDPKVTLN